LKGFEMIEPFSMKPFGTTEPKKVPAKKVTTGKKVKTQPKSKVIAAGVKCPYCNTVNIFRKDTEVLYCNKCGKRYSR